MPETAEQKLEKAAIRRGTLTGLLGLGTVAMIVLAVVAAVPLLPSGKRDAKQAEGEQLMNAARDEFRIGYSKNRDLADAHAMLNKKIGAGRLTARWYRIESPATRLSDGRWQVTAVPNEAGLKTGFLSFDMESGESEIVWR